MSTPDSGFPNVPHGSSTVFCQQCGKPLDSQTRRNVGAAIYCEPCLEARLASATQPAGAGIPPSAAWQQQPLVGFPPATPNPRLATLLGFIPGVGAMYNEQYAKGIAHLAIFALLVVLSDANAVFGLFIAGWEFYMAFEAYHTAVARREGLPLPNPFGFNDLGERLGFGRGWTHPGRPAGPFASAPSQPATAAGSPFQSTAPPVPRENEPWQAASTDSESSPGPAPASSWDNVSSQPSWAAAAGQGYSPVDPFAPAPNVTPAPSAAPTPLQRAPFGAIWLILLGVLFLLSTTRHFHPFSPEILLGWGLIGLSGWLFLSRYRDASRYQGSSMRLVYAVRPSAWCFTSGILTLLDGSGLLSWGRSWPVFLITAGLLALLNRAASHESANSPAPPATML